MNDLTQEEEQVQESPNGRRMAAREARALTRAQRFQYFVREVLDKDENDPLVTCLVYNGIQSIPDILALSDRTMERMKYVDD